MLAANSAARRTGTTVDETDKRLKKRQDKAKFQAVVPKKKGPLEPN